MLTRVSEHKPAALNDYMSAEKFYKKLELYQDKIRAAVSELLSSDKQNKAISADIERALEKNVKDLTPFMKVARCLMRAFGAQWIYCDTRGGCQAGS